MTYAVPEAPSFRSTRPAAPDVLARAFEPLVREHAARQGLRPDLVRAVIQVESGFNPLGATSPKGAMGLMQLMPATARELGVRNPYDPADNIRGGTTYLRQLLDRYDGQRGTGAGRLQRRFSAVDKHGRPRAALPGNPGIRPQGRLRRRRSVRPATSRSGGKLVIYKVVEIVDGRDRALHDRTPASGAYEIVQR